MGQFEITFLGTTAGVPTKYRNHASIYVKHQAEKEFVCLLDCGEGTQKQIFTAGLNFMRVSDIFISHWHADHFAGLLGLMETMNLEKRTKPLRIFGPEAKKFVPILLSLGYSTKDFDLRAMNVEHEGSAVNVIHQEEEIEVQSIPMKHGIPSVAYAVAEKDKIKIDKEKALRLGLPATGPLYKQLKDHGKTVYKDKEILLEDVSFIEKGKKIVYSGDTLPNKNMIKLAKDADVLIHDSTFFSERKESYRHATFEDVIELAEKANVKKLILTHISRRYADVKELEDKVKQHPNAILAKDFMKIVV